MNKSVSIAEAGLQISPKSVLVVLAVLGLGLSLLGDAHPEPAGRLQLLTLALLLYTVLAIAWLLDTWKPWIGRWFMVIGLVAVINLSHNQLVGPGFLALTPIPTALAAALIGLPAAAATAIGETALLLLLPGYTTAGASLATIVTVLIANWMMLGLMVAVYQPTRQITRWSWEHFQRAQSLLEEARDRKAELEHALAELMHANRQLDLLNEKLAGMRLIAEEAQKAKTAFVAKVSHEFRTPLNMIIGLTDLLAETPEVYDEELPPPLLEDLKIVQRNCEHLSSMVNDVLDLSQAEAGHMALHREWVDLTEAVASAMAVVSPLLEKKGLDLQAIIPDDLPKVYCDRTRIRQVILNLVSNAARFTEEGGITIHVAQEAQYVVVSVADTGPGISPEDADRIFEPFCQGSSMLWRDKGGSGLGLSISKQFVELHGGRIWLKSEPGMGSTFSFKLPVFPATALVVGPEHRIGEDWVWTERTSRPDPPRLPLKERVVIYDETGGLYPWLTHYSDEVEFVEACDLVQTIQELRQCPAHAVILNTPSPDTLWPMAERASLEMPDTPVIGCSLLPQIERALKAGATDYLIKPVRRADLAEAIQAVGKPVKRVLVVDDDPDVLQLSARMLSVCDCELEVVTASNGEQALEELRDRAPDLILLDILMPDMDGWQVLELKNRDEATKDIPVIIISAQDPAEQPTTSKMLLATIGGGLSVNQLLRCSIELSRFLLKPD